MNRRFLVVITIFKQDFYSSVSFNSLTDILERNVDRIKFKIVVIDNSPDIPESNFILQNSFSYKAMGRNAGLPTAYNLALDIASKEGFTHLITLDQDSNVNESYIDSVLRHVKSIDGDTVVWVPTVLSNDRLISPFYFNTIGLPRYAFKSKGCFAINSFSVYDVAYLKKINGFINYYWLDGLDFTIFAEIEKNSKICQLLPVIVNHDLSLLTGNLSVNRIENIARFESIFFCEYMKFSQILIGIFRVFLRGVKLLKSQKKSLNIIFYSWIIISGSLMGFRRRLSRPKHHQ